MKVEDKPTGGKKERFHRVAERRVNNVLNAIRLLGQCSNPRTYEYTEEDVQRMFREIERELRDAKQSFASREDGREFRFLD